MMLSECLLLGLFLMMELTLDFANFSGTSSFDSARRTLEERIRNLELKNCQYDPQFFISQEANTEGSSSRGGSRRSSRKRAPSLNDV